ncbi:phospholipase A and acyltransferase 1-like [Cololabis saira]|uniref:phospholipase A and acyltransferase 1-like n=1 Tax=Cololabis saira TaxID=129043 RepID=UPI002AD57FA6|nr:phospholipase A and acyltransferase 1-like [Cololabis saira]
MGSSSSSAASITKFKDKDGKKVKSGNLIEIFRGDDSYWAVYVGCGNIVHLVPHDSEAGTGVVLKQKLQDVVEERKWRVNNLLDDKYTPHAVNDIVKTACSLAKTKKQYNLLKYNSQNVATYMRYGKPESQQEVKRGDLIEISRRGFKHWAVSVGFGNIVHFVTPRFCCRTGVVLMQKLDDVLKKDKCTVNNLLDDKYTPRPADEIVEEARSLVDTELEYDLKNYNCEHFATEMRYDKPESQQVKNNKALVNAASGFMASYRSMKNSGFCPPRMNQTSLD